MAKLKRVDVLLTEDTQEKLTQIAEKISWNCTMSDLIRYALYKVYDIEFSSAHVWLGKIEETLPEILKAKKSKRGQE